MYVLVVGTGSIGCRHIDNLKELVDDLQFIFLRKNGRHNSYSRQLSAKIITRYEDISGYNISLAVIASPPIYHYQAIDFLMNLGIPCYIEKPIVAFRSDFNRLNNLVNSLDRLPITTVGCNLRYLPSLIKFRSLVHQEVVGNIVRAHFEAGQWLPTWRPGDYRAYYSSYKELGGGVLLDLIHEVDMIRWIFGEFSRIEAISGKYSSLDITSNDTLIAILESSTSQCLISLHLDYVSRRPVRRYEVVGDKGTLIWDLQANSLQVITQEGIQSIDCGDLGFDIDTTYKLAMKNFLKAVKSNQTCGQDIYEGLESLELAFRIDDASRP